MCGVRFKLQAETQPQYESNAGTYTK